MEPSWVLYRVPTTGALEELWQGTPTPQHASACQEAARSGFICSPESQLVCLPGPGEPELERLTRCIETGDADCSGETTIADVEHVGRFLPEPEGASAIAPALILLALFRWRR